VGAGLASSPRSELYHRAFEIAAISHVAVQGHRRNAEFFGEAHHRKAICSLLVQQLARCTHDHRAVQANSLRRCR
jgi:hypothetical protein